MNSNQIFISNILCEFFEVAIHNIIYIKRLYPDSAFLPKSKYGVIVHQCIHPDVKSYIFNALKAVKYHLEKNKLKQLCLVFQSGTHILEKFVFDIVRVSFGVDSDPFLLRLERILRDACLKLNACNTYTEPLNEEATFGIQISTSELSFMEFNDTPSEENFPWVHCYGEESFLLNSDVLPVCNFKCNSLNMHIYVEIPLDKC